MEKPKKKIPKNFKGKKGRSGRKKKEIEYQFVIAKAKEEATNELLQGKAKNITNGILNKIEKNGFAFQHEVKDVVMPITLKGMVDKVENTHLVGIVNIENMLRERVKLEKDANTTIDKGDSKDILPRRTRETDGANSDTVSNLRLHLEKAAQS